MTQKFCPSCARPDSQGTKSVSLPLSHEKTVLSPVLAALILFQGCAWRPEYTPTPQEYLMGAVETWRKNVFYIEQDPDTRRVRSVVIAVDPAEHEEEGIYKEIYSFVLEGRPRLSRTEVTYRDISDGLYPGIKRRIDVRYRFSEQEPETDLGRKQFERFKGILERGKISNPELREILDGILEEITRIMNLPRKSSSFDHTHKIYATVVIPDGPVFISIGKGRL
ncbi:MAG: hypothetical protein V2A77_00580 [Pseudomonadota bacterium]